ncbi:hypothetical protein OHB93_09720 [Microbacterium sp. No. 7]|uniref:hypothetical protein n=1 Tax=Microbacterium sp. No. 7 TaxID=1714373 RepID=UPI003008BD42
MTADDDAMRDHARLQVVREKANRMSGGKRISPEEWASFFGGETSVDRAVREEIRVGQEPTRMLSGRASDVARSTEYRLSGSNLSFRPGATVADLAAFAAQHPSALVDAYFLSGTWIDAHLVLSAGDVVLVGITPAGSGVVPA